MSNVHILPISELLLDIQNPRFGLNETSTQDEALRYLVQRGDLKELWDSFAQKGFQQFEPLIGVKVDPITMVDPANEAERVEVDQYVIVEGNRRLAAAKTMLDPSLSLAHTKKSVPELPAKFRHSLECLPVYVVSKREDAYDYIGFKHINGPSSWGSLAKAKFGVLLFEEGKSKGSDLSQVLNDLAKRLGDNPSQALRTLVGYKIFEQAIKLEYVEDPASADVQIDFSHLYTVLPNPAARKYLGLGIEPLKPEQIATDPIPDSHHHQLKNMMTWLFGSAEKEPVIKRQGSDRPKLLKVLANEQATETLEQSGDFEQAVQQAGYLKDNWLSNVVKLQTLAKGIFSDISEMSEPLNEQELKTVVERLSSSGKNIENTLKVLK